MDPAKTGMDFFRFSGHRMGSLSVFVLLLFVKYLLYLSLNPPGFMRNARAYGFTYFIVPLIFLFILGLLLRRRRSPGLFSPRCCSFSYFLYVMVQAGKAPLIWILLFMIDDRFLVSFANTVNTEIILENIHESVQIVGLAGLAILLILDYGIPQSTWAQKFFSCYFQKRYEDLILEEIEAIIQQKVEEKRKAFVEDLIRSDLDQLTPEELFKKGTVPELVWKYKEIGQKKCAEGSLELNEAYNVLN